MNKQGVSIVILLCSAIAFSQGYEITRLGTLGGAASSASSINDNSQVTGYIRYDFIPPGPTSREAFLWSSAETIMLGQLGGLQSVANALNNYGEVVGVFDDDELRSNAFYWNSQIGMQKIDLPQETTYAASHGINNAGQILVYARRSDEYWPLEHLVYIGTLDKGFTSLEFPTPLGGVAFGISDAGHIAGSAVTDLDNFATQRAYIWQDGQMTFLEGLGGTADMAYSVNSFGIAVGSSRLATFIPPNIYPTHAVMWKDGMVYDLGTLGGMYARAVSINDDGLIVGQAETADGINHACLWRDGQIIDLNVFLPADSEWDYLELACDTNIHGQIVGTGFINGQREVFMLTPIPEPTSIGLLILGGLIIRKLTYGV